MNDTNSSDKRAGRKALGHVPISKWGQRLANKKSRKAAKKLANKSKNSLDFSQF